MNDYSEANSNREFQLLLDRLLNGALTSAEDERLSHLLETEPEVRQVYVDQVWCETFLKWTFCENSERLPGEEHEPIEDASGLRPVADAPSVSIASRFHRRSVFLGTAGLLLASLAVFVLCLPFPGPGEIEQRPIENALHGTGLPKYVAVLIDSEDAVWEHSDGAREYGMSYREGDRVELKSGLIRLAFHCGAGVVLQGPARLELCSDRLALLHQGKLAAFVPQEAIGFTVLTPDMRIVDLGTTFGAEVDASGQASVHVYEGEVSIQPREGPEPDEALLLHAETRPKFSQTHVEPPGISVASVDSNDIASVPSPEQLRHARSGAYPPPARTVPLPLEATNRQATLPAVSPFVPGSAWLSESFYPSNPRESSSGASHPWIMDGNFSRIVHLEEPLRWQSLVGGAFVVELDGRDPAFPFLCNRLEARLARPLRQDFYFSFLGRYHGLDPDDFFALWFDNNLGAGISHANMPNVGIRFGDFFARMKLDEFAATPVLDGDATFFLTGHLQKVGQSRFSRLSLWINPDLETWGPPHLEIELPGHGGPTSLSTLGFRMGKNTEPDDKLWVDRLLIGFQLDDVLHSTRVTNGESNSEAGLDRFPSPRKGLE